MLFSSHLWSSFPEVTSIKKHSKLIEKQDREQLEIAEVDSRVPAPIDTNSGCRHRPSASTHSFNATCRQHLITTANISNSKWRGYFVLHRKHLIFLLIFPFSMTLEWEILLKLRKITLKLEVYSLVRQVRWLQVLSIRSLGKIWSSRKLSESMSTKRHDENKWEGEEPVKKVYENSKNGKLKGADIKKITILLHRIVC